MAAPDPTQKQISRRYDGEAGYPGQAHYFRRWRWGLLGAAAAVSLSGTLLFSLWGKQSAYSPGPVSLNHARLASDCRACHLDADLTLLQRAWPQAKAGMAPATEGPAFSRMDEACLQCHVGKKLHLPQAASLLAPGASAGLSVVHATGCATCHREHAGRNLMALPGQSACLSCHEHPEQLEHARRTVPLTHAPAPGAGSHDPGDGVIRFFAPHSSADPLPAMASFAAGHPAFAYEGQRDPAALAFNHEVHLRLTVKGKGSAAGNTCLSCHQPGANGAFFQPIRYEKHCAECHSLQFRSTLANLRLPHGNAELVRSFLAGRQNAFEMAVREEGETDESRLHARVASEMDLLRRQGLDSLEKLEQLVFFDGDPKTLPTDRRQVAAGGKFLTECAKCHPGIQRGAEGAVPKVQPTAMAEQWLQHGAFTHLPHQYMTCANCHDQARTSTKTSDILLPAQASCAKCHRAPAAGASLLRPAGAEIPGQAQALADAQKESGGVKANCTDCHRFHSPPNAAETLVKLTGAGAAGASNPTREGAGAP